METRVIMPDPQSNWEECVQRYWEKEKKQRE
ncbi:hypothetical protein DFP93_12243 [Aneurinibacillus soli]|uniref:Uncharacterized protein n=1 Tax=Aneurinibacillus soli TaxID=1500254 RepID=A0A0U5B0T3_9BACL|nr:hypothetical protein DFP93_12243 [Aneurinibacillus soli]BAU29601.1 hypothetical protein CB4_03812 [Aneurinibacillus soli]